MITDSSPFESIHGASHRVRNLIHIHRVLSDQSLSWSERLVKVHDGGGEGLEFIASWRKIQSLQVIGDENDWTAHVLQYPSTVPDTLHRAETAEKGWKSCGDGTEALCELLFSAERHGFHNISAAILVNHYRVDGHTSVSQFEDTILAINNAELWDSTELLLSLFGKRWEQAYITAKAKQLRAAKVLTTSKGVGDALKTLDALYSESA